MSNAVIARIGVPALLVMALVGCGVFDGPPDGAPPPGHVIVAGYAVPWDARSTPGAGAGVLAEVSPVWFQPTDAGTIDYVSDQARASESTVAGAGVDVTPSIQNFRAGRWDGELVAWLVTDPQRRGSHIAAIVDLVSSRGWPGIDIDYESLPAASRSDYSTFITELADALHALPARLSVTVHAKTSEPGSWHGAQAQDWRAIGAAADEVRVMAYDYSTAASPPGPIAPLSWVDQVLELATEEVPLDRIALGLPTYGYDWSSQGPAAAVQWTDVQAISEARGASPQWNDDVSSPSLRYPDDQGGGHVVWYEDAASLETKLDLAQRHGIGRVVLWRLGGEDPAIWPILRSAQ
jgi:spore germination protein